MRFDYSPETPDDWPDVITVSVSGVEGEQGFEEGNVRCYEPNWKHRVAGDTIRKQREEIQALEAERRKWESRFDALNEAIEGKDGWRESCHALTALVLDMRECLGDNHASLDDLAEFDERMREAGIEVRDEVER